MLQSPFAPASVHGIFRCNTQYSPFVLAQNILSSRNKTPMYLNFCTHVMATHGWPVDSLVVTPRVMLSASSVDTSESSLGLWRPLEQLLCSRSCLDSKKSIQDPGVPARLVIRCDGPLSFLWRHTAVPFFGRQNGSRFEQMVRRASRLFTAQEGSLLIINFSELSSIISCFSCQLGYFRRFRALWFIFVSRGSAVMPRA